jgi:Tfp pilus assembly protein PilV
MAASKSNKKFRTQRGFTLLETLGAIVVLTVGLLAMAALMSQTSGNSSRSRYMSAASILATEKLEELNRYPNSDPMVAVAGSSVGNLNADVSAAGINYFDDVELSATGGAITEVTSDSSGNYNTIVHQPDGTITSTTSASAPAPLPQSLIYHRRWVIEKDAPVAGVRRITVFVQLTNPPVVRPLTFQMSTVRP